MTSLSPSWGEGGGWVVEEARGPDISALSRQITLTGLTAEQGSTAPCVEEKILTLRHILDINLSTAVYSCKDAVFWGDHVSWSNSQGIYRVLAGTREPLTLRVSGAAGSTAG